MISMEKQVASNSVDNVSISVVDEALITNTVSMSQAHVQSADRPIIVVGDTVDVEVFHESLSS